jgi:hypothetical protein
MDLVERGRYSFGLGFRSQKEHHRVFETRLKWNGELHTLLDESTQFLQGGD